MCLTFFSCLGKYQSGVDKPDPKTWKANFRCAMNSLPDIEEVKDKSIKKGNNAFRVYRMLPLSERPSKKGRGKNLSMWKWCLGCCYYFESCKMCQFYFSWCEAGCFYPDVPQNTGTSIYVKNGLYSVKTTSYLERRSPRWDIPKLVIGVNCVRSVKADGVVFRSSSQVSCLFKFWGCK